MKPKAPDDIDDSFDADAATKACMIIGLIWTMAVILMTIGVMTS